MVYKVKTIRDNLPPSGAQNPFFRCSVSGSIVPPSVSFSSVVPNDQGSEKWSYHVTCFTFHFILKQLSTTVVKWLGEIKFLISFKARYETFYSVIGFILPQELGR